jgi:hypothetical protein
MSGLFLVPLITYFAVFVWRVITERGSGKWPVSGAMVLGDPFLDEGTLSKVVMVYSYLAAGQLHYGSYDTPFLSSSSADEFARRFVKGGTVRVRVKPGDPERSIIREEDQ